MQKAAVQDPFAQVTPATLAQHKQLLANSRKFVSQAFYGQLLQQMNKSPFRSDLFSGGRGQQAFFPMLAQHLSDRMAGSAGGKLPARLAQSMEGRAKFKMHEAYIKAGRDTSGSGRAALYRGTQLDQMQ